MLLTPGMKIQYTKITMNGGNTTTINISTATILKIVAVFLALGFIYLVYDILLTVFVAIILAALIEPLVNGLQKKRVPRAIGIILIYALLVIFFSIIIRLLIPPFVEQISLLASNFPDFWNWLVENFQVIKQYSAEQGYLETIRRGLEGVEGNLSRVVSVVSTVIISIFKKVINFLLILVVTFYLVMERDAFAKILRALTPIGQHQYVTELAARIQLKIGSWARGQLLLGLIIGTLSFFGLIFLLPQYALVLAVVAGVTELVPYLGPTLGAIPAVFLGLTVSPWHGAMVLILYLAILENNLIVPQVMKRQVGLNPVVVIVAMLVGARLVGLIGIILAVPVIASIGLVVKDFVDRSNQLRPSATTDTDVDT